jgi:uncharacterized protein YndB with AHSA1/START domain
MSMCTTAEFTIDRRFAASPARVFTAFADIDAKRRWFGVSAGAWTPGVREMDFRVGGRERLSGTWPDGTASDFQATYHDIVPNERIVYVSDMYHGRDAKLSVSLVTIALTPDRGGTRMVLTEQGVFFDDPDGNRSRETGTKSLMDALEKSLGA